MSVNKLQYQAFVVPSDAEDRACFEGEYAKPYGLLSEKYLNKGFEKYFYAENWAKSKAQKGEVIYIFDRRKTGKTQRIKKEFVRI